LNKKELVVEGLKDILSLLDICPEHISKILVHKKAETLDEFCNIENLALKYKIDLVPITEREFRELRKTVHSQGIFALVDFIEQDLETCLKDKLNIVVLDNVQDPGNIGTIIRTVNLLSSSVVVLLKGCAKIENPKLIRAAKGVLFDIPVLEDIDLTELLRFLQIYNYRIFAAHIQGDSIYNKNVKFENPMCVFFGSEGKGVNKRFGIANKIYIPMTKNESLNVAVSVV
jgi:TrmH family RNA methyltransferase